MNIRSSLFAAPVLAALVVPAAPVAAQERFQTAAPCGQALGQASPEIRALVAGWVLGFMEAGLKQGAGLGLAERDQALATMDKLCVSYPDRSLIEITAAMVTLAQRDQQAQAAADPASGSEAAARALVAQFLAPGADFAALTRALEPTESDIRAVYTDPLAANMARVYPQVWADAENLTITPKPGQTEVLLWYATTDKLIAKDPILDKFPGGYADVLTYMRPGFPIVRFKFVRPGESTGLAYDGLIFVNDHWVLMPKPWRLLP